MHIRSAAALAIADRAELFTDKPARSVNCFTDAARPQE